jgi:peptide/nickel transport system permease protein
MLEPNVQLAVVAEDAVAPNLGVVSARRALSGGRIGTVRANLHWIVLGAFALLAVLAPVIAPYSPIASSPTELVLPPSWRHLFGTDTFGFDVFSRVIWGARWDLAISVIGVILAALIGVVVGALSGYIGGAVDDGLSRVTEISQSFPVFLFALMVFAALGNSPFVLVGVVAFAFAPVFFKLTRSIVLPLRTSDFVAASRAAGLTPPEIVIRHVLPNSLAPLASQFSIACAYSIQIVAGLSFLGLGVPIPYPEWGSMIQEGAGRIIFGQWWPAVFPGIAILLVAIAFQGIGRQLNRYYSR